MKPCFRNRKLIAWLVLDALDATKAAALREHFAVCEGCRRYWEEVSSVAETLASAQPGSEIEASESFYRRVAERLQAAETGSVLEDLMGWVRGLRLNLRVAVPAIAVLVTGLLVMLALQHDSTFSPPKPATPPTLSASSPGGDLAPTIANYQRAANESLEKLEELLTAQGNRRLPPAPVYTVWGLGSANGAF